MRFEILTAAFTMIVAGAWAEPLASNPADNQPAAVQVAKAAAPASAQSSNKKEPTKAVKPTQLYVVDGCDACAALLNYLSKAGVKFEMKKVDRSNCSAYPTVVYSDGVADHGERIYANQVPLPKSVKVEDARSGS